MFYNITSQGPSLSAADNPFTTKCLQDDPQYPIIYVIWSSSFKACIGKDVLSVLPTSKEGPWKIPWLSHDFEL